MSGFYDDDEGVEEQMEEVVVDDAAPFDDESDAGGDFGVDSAADYVVAPDMSFVSFSGHRDSVYCAALHPTLPGVAITGGGDDVAYIWKFAKRAEESPANNVTAEGLPAVPADPQGEIVSSIKLSGHTDTVTSVGFNFNGTLALTGGYDGAVRIWQVSDGELVQTLEGPEDIEWAQWHGKGNAVVAGSRDGTIWMWLTHNGQCVHVFAGHDGGVTAGTFTKDGKMICTGGEDGTVRQWNPKSGQCRHVFAQGDAHEADVTCIANGGADADFILTGSADGTVKLYQLSGKRLLQTFIHSARLSEEESGAMETVHEGRDEGQGAAAEEEEGEDMGYEEEDEIEERTVAVLGVECVGFANGEWKWVASGGMDKTLKVWDTMTRTVRCSCMHGGGVVALVWHSTLPLVATAALDNVVRVWDARNGALLLELTGHNDLVTSIEMVPITAENRVDGCGDATDMIISVSDDKTARVFMINVHSLVAA